MTLKTLTKLFASISLLGTLSVVACDPVQDREATSERQPVGKADAAAGTCDSRCGEFDATEACQCDEQCLQLGDCCEDFSAVCGGGDGESEDDEGAVLFPLTFDFDFRTGDDYGFVGLFRDIKQEQFENYTRLVEAGESLGPVPPETETMLMSDAERSHWFMNAGVYEVADNPGIKGYLLQGVNRSDDMDKYMVRAFGPEEGLEPNTTYRVQMSNISYAANDRLGAFGPGGGEVRSFDLVLTNWDPFPYEVDFNGYVRFTDESRPTFSSERATGAGTTAACWSPGTFPGDGGGLEHCPEGRVPYKIMGRSDPSKWLTISTNDDGRFWMLIGGHSGHESLDDYYIIDMNITVDEMVQ